MAGRPEAALVDDASAIRIEPGFAKAYVNRGNAMAGLEDEDGALRDYRAALQVAPRNWPHRARVERLIHDIEGP